MPEIVEVHANQTSSWAGVQALLCCGLSLAPTVLTLNVPLPAMAVAVEQSLEP